MFYVKETMNDSMAVSIEINDENVFCSCPDCGIEVSVDIREVLSDGISDLFGTRVCCDDCARKRHMEG